MKQSNTETEFSFETSERLVPIEMVTETFTTLGKVLVEYALFEEGLIKGGESKEIIEKATFSYIKKIVDQQQGDYTYLSASDAIAGWILASLPTIYKHKGVRVLSKRDIRQVRFVIRKVLENAVNENI